MRRSITARLAGAVAAVACLPLVGAGTAVAAHEGQLVIDTPGAHYPELHGIYEVHVWGGAGSGSFGPGGYVCWKGELDGVVPTYVGSMGAGNGGGASTMVESPQGEPVAIAGGGGGQGWTSRGGGTVKAGGHGGVQSKPLAANTNGEFKGGDGSGELGGAGGKLSGGKAGPGTGDGVEAAGGDGSGGDGGDSATGAGGTNGTGLSDGAGGYGRQYVKGKTMNAGGGGGGYGGGAGGGALPNVGGTVRAGGGGGGGSFVQASPTPCTTEDIGDNNSWSTYEGSTDGRVIFIPAS